MTRIAVLRCGKLPGFVTWEVPNLDELFEEDKLLLRGFREQGHEAEPVVWNDPSVDWDRFDLALIRSTWDYLDEREQFLKVLSDVEASNCRLFNSLEAIRWNIDKHYLFVLEQWGIPIIPTLLASDLEENRLPGWLTENRSGSVILKPTVGLGGSHSYRVPLHELKDTLEKLGITHPQQEFLVQPYLEDIVTEGEWSFIYFNRQLSHVLLKRPAPGDYRVQGIYGGSIQAAEPRREDKLQAEQVLEKIPFDVLYARLDFVRADGRLSVMEVELIEPIFSFNLVPASIACFVKAALSRLEG
jgi:glutathione synthase/RimK-type ligase-like ATP-grasp enzyme